MKKLLVIVFLASFSCAQNPQFPWLSEEFPVNKKIKSIPSLSGYNRVKTDSNSFAEWLQNLPLKDKSEKVRLFNNRLKLNQTAHYRIINIDRGKKDLQQCADAVIRLRAEYLYYLKSYDQIHFNFTSGDNAKFIDWIAGLRPQVNNNQVKWEKTGKTVNDYATFKKYLETVFMYAGSYSLKKELTHISKFNDVKIGDVFIRGEFPGHAVIVVDQCINPKNNRIAVLLAQSYMPAQDIHILKNPINKNTNPWYILKEEDKLYTPEWTFEWSDSYRFR